MRRRPLLIALIAGSAVTGVLGTGRLLAVPGGVGEVVVDPAAGLRFQGRVAQLLLRQSGLSSGSDPIVISESEVNAFLARHLETRRLPVRPVVARIGPGWIELAGQTRLGRLFHDSPWRGVTAALPAALAELPVWVTLRGALEVRAGSGRLIVERAGIGRQRVPSSLIWKLLGVESGDLAWSMPRIVTLVALEPGRIAVHTRREVR